MPLPSRNHERAALASGMVSVDADGRVWRHWRAGRPVSPPYRAETLRPDGYMVVPLVLSGRPVRILAHRLVYVALVGPVPPGAMVRHWSRDRADNRPSNLVLVRAAAGGAGAAGVPDGGAVHG